jgi:Flp pilus assembly protein TadG
MGDPAWRRSSYSDLAQNVGRAVRVHAARGKARSDQGAAAVEFALIAVLLITLLLGIIQYGFLFWESQTASRVAREIGRSAAVGTLTCDQLFTNAQNYAPAQAGDIAINVDFPGGPAVGQNVSATVTFPYTKLGFPFIPVPGGSNASETAVVRIESVTGNSVDCVRP